MSRWVPIRLRNALTESWNEGRSIDHIMSEHGLSERAVVDHLDANRAGFMSYRDDGYIEHKANKSQKVSKPSNKSSKVIPHYPAKDALESVRECSTGTCAICGDPILKTGSRGRPRKTHKECAK